MSEPEVYWHGESGRNFLADLQSFCRSLDYVDIRVDVRGDTGTEVELLAEGYRLVPTAGGRNFACPACGATSFHVAEGILDNRPVLGLACRACESYGVLFPKGL